jgi:hypothetical protein
MVGAFLVQRRRGSGGSDLFVRQAWEERMRQKYDDFEVTMNDGGVPEVTAADVQQDKHADGSDIRVPIRTRFSFHGDPKQDELDVPAGVTLTGVSRNRRWWVAIDEQTKTIGLIPANYVNEV